MKAVIATIVAAVLCFSTQLHAQYERNVLNCEIWNNTPDLLVIKVAGKSVTLNPNQKTGIKLPIGNYPVYNQVIINGKVDSVFEYNWTVNKSNNRLVAYQTTLFKELKKLLKPIF